MKGRGDAIGHQLAVGVDQRQARIEMDARPRHELALEGIAVHIDDPGQDQQMAGIATPSS